MPIERKSINAPRGRRLHIHIVHDSMNNMKDGNKRAVKTGKTLRRLSLSVGDFIRYWGFRRIHGAVWTQLYLSRTPLSCTNLTHKLGLSKALISPALIELCNYKLIHEAPAPNEKTKVYEASENINEVIQHVLRVRESKMLKKITSDFSAFQQSDATAEDLSQTRVKSLESMIFSANIMLEMMLAQEDFMNLPMEFEK
jgi:DNA-binding transcriptional regulator GbsR (MarR family)